MSPVARIVVLDGQTVNPGDLAWDEVAALGQLTVHDRTTPAEVRERSYAAQVLLTNKVRLSREVLADLPRLRFVSVLATGYDVVDLHAARQLGVPVSNVPEYATDSVAQHTFALLLELSHRVGDHARAVAAGRWIAAPDFSFWLTPPRELAGLTMGIIGFGRIGRRVGEIAHAFGMNVLASGGQSKGPPGYEPFAWLPTDRVFEEADVVSLHCPLTAETARLVDSTRLSRMKPGSVLLNTARGALVDETALAAALRSGPLAGAGLDVLAREPMAADCPLRGAPNCVITPHMAWASRRARARLLSTTAGNIAAFLAGRPQNLVV